MVWLQLFPKKLLVEKGEIFSDESKVANSFNNFFEMAIHSLRIKTSKYPHESHGLKSPDETAIRKFEQKILFTKILLSFFTNRA